MPTVNNAAPKTVPRTASSRLMARSSRCFSSENYCPLHGGDEGVQVLPGGPHLHPLVSHLTQLPKPLAIGQELVKKRGQHLRVAAWKDKSSLAFLDQVISGADTVADDGGEAA